MNLKGFEINIKCKKCNGTNISLAVNQWHEITAECIDCGNSEKLR